MMQEEADGAGKILSHSAALTPAEGKRGGSRIGPGEPRPEAGLPKPK